MYAPLYRMLDSFLPFLSPVRREAEPPESRQPAAGDRVLVGDALLAEGEVGVGADLGQPRDPRDEVGRLLEYRRIPLATCWGVCIVDLIFIVYRVIQLITIHQQRSAY